MIKKLMLAIVFCAYSLPAAEETGSIELPSHQPPTPGAKLMGSFEVRPSVESGSGRTFSENAGEIGYQFNSSTPQGSQI